MDHVSRDPSTGSNTLFSLPRTTSSEHSLFSLPRTTSSEHSLLHRVMSGEQKKGAETSSSRADNEKIEKPRKPSDETRDRPANGLSREK